MAQTLGQYLFNSALPSGFKFNGPVNSKELSKTLVQVAKHDPQKYVHVVTELKRLGDEVATVEGISVGLDDIAPHYETRDPVIKDALSKVKNVQDPAERRKLLLDTQSKIKGLAEKHPGDMGLMARSGGRGNLNQMMKTVSSPVAVANYKGDIVPWLITRSYSEGLKPAEYWVAGDEARQNVVSGKIEVTEPGEVGKLLIQTMYDHVVTDPDCGTSNGIPVPADDTADLADRYLAQPAAGYQRNTLVTPEVARDLAKKLGNKPVLVRSPMTCQHRNGGLCSKCVGLNEKGQHHTIGTNVGVRSAQAMCLGEGTQVRMADGSVKAIETISPGEFVLGSDTTGKTFPVRVLNLYANGVKPVYQTTFRPGLVKTEAPLTINSTLDHRILSVTSTRANPRPGPTVTTVVPPSSARFYAKLPTGYDDAHIVDEPNEAKFALIIGLLIGDGCYTGSVTSNGISFSCHDPSLIEDVAPTLNELGCKFVPQHTPGEFRVSSLDGPAPVRGTTATAIRNPVRQVLVNLGLWGQRSSTKTLPDTRNWKNTSVAKLLAGLIATDGYVSRTTNSVVVGYSSNSLTLVSGFRDLLASRFGIYTSAPGQSAKPHPNGGYYSPQYSVAVGRRADVEKLAASIEIPGVKDGRLIEGLNQTRPNNKARESGRCTFVSQTYLGELPTYDLEVDHPDHLYVLANGIITHNSEPLTQMILSAKHGTKLVKGETPGQQGLDAVKSLVNVPRVFPYAATVAKQDGLVTKILPAPQGGSFVHINDTPHYVPPDLEVTARVQHKVEAGDPLSTGVARPDEIVEHKGLGAGRKYLVDSLAKVYREAGVNLDKRHLEVLARAQLNHVEIEHDPRDEFLRSDIVPFNQVRARLASDAESLPVDKADGHTLAQDYTYFSAGTRVTPSVISALKSHGVTSVLVAKDPIKFKFVMNSLEQTPLLNPNWMARLGHRYLKKGLENAAQLGEEADLHGLHPVPGFVYGLDFGHHPGGHY